MSEGSICTPVSVWILFIGHEYDEDGVRIVENVDYLSLHFPTISAAKH